MQETDPALNYVNTHTKEQILFKLNPEYTAKIEGILELEGEAFKSKLIELYKNNTTLEEKKELERVFSEPIRRNSAPFGGRHKTVRRRRGKKVRKTRRRR